MAKPVYEKGRAEKRYLELVSTRSPYETRGIECCKYTIPSLFTPHDSTNATVIGTPHQSMGSRGVNNISSKIMMALFPPNNPFFRMLVDSYKVAQTELKDDKAFMTDLEEALGRYERRLLQEVEMSSDRSVFFEGVRHLVAVGNILFHDDEKAKGMRAFHLDRYVVKRDAMGEVKEILVEEELSPSQLPDELVEKLIQKGVLNQGNEKEDEKTVNAYTYIERQKNNWTVYQEVRDEIIPGSEGEYPLDACPWFALRMIRVSGEDYGRSYVEEYLGDLISLEGLMESIYNTASIASKVIIMVDPASSTSPDDLAKAKSGDVIEGRKDDVSAFQLDKYYDLKTVLETIKMLQERLSHAFLMNTAVQRNAERVTAEEIRYVAGELEDALGGIYSILTQEFQLQYLKVKMKRLEKQGILPNLPKDIVSPTIITGLDALGRGHERQKLSGYLQTLSTVFTPQGLMSMVNRSDVAKRFATADGIDVTNLIKTEEEINQETQQGQMMQMFQQMMPKMMEMFGKGAPNGGGTVNE